MPGPLAARLQAPLQRLAVRFGLQAFIGLFCLLAILSPPAVWNALSLLDANVTPVYAIVSFAVCLQPNVGAALFIGLQRIVGVLVGGALGVAATYIAYAANGHTFEDSVTKGAVMVTILAVWTFAIGCYRAKYTRFPFAFTVCAFSAPMVALSGFHLDYVEDKVIFYWWMQALIGVTASSLVSMLIFPNLASTGVKKTTQSSLEELGRATMQLVSLLFPTTQGLQGANVIPSDAMDLYLETYGTPIAAGLQKARAALLASWTEVDVYNRPHLFPRNAYGVLLSLLRHYLSTLSTLSYLLSGEAPLKAAQSLRKPVSEVATGIQETLAAAATCLRGDSDITYLDVLRCLTQLEGSLHELGRIRAGSPTEHLSTEQMRQRHSSTVGQPRSCADGSDATADVKSGGDGYTEGEILVADTILAVMFSLGTFVRQLCFVLPEAIHHPGPECRKAWRKHFKGSKWDFDEEGNDHRHPTLRASAPTSPAALHRLASLTASLPSPREVNTLSEREAVVLGASNGKDTNSGSIASSGGLPGSSPRRLPQKAFPQLILADSGVIQRSPKNSWVDGFAEDFFAFIERGLGLRRAHLVAGFQCAICLAAAATLHVCNASYRALGEKTIWVVVTVLVMFQSTIGGILLRGVNRIVATVVAGLLGVR